jgi:hypothetical protein
MIWQRKLKEEAVYIGVFSNRSSSQQVNIFRECQVCSTSMECPPTLLLLGIKSAINLAADILSS